MSWLNGNLVKWFWSHICGVRENDRAEKVYDVYCPVSRQVKKNLSSKFLRPMSDPKKHPSRADFVTNGQTFWYDGDDVIPLSQWVVRRVKHEKNVFTCSRLLPEECPGPNIDDFHVGFVMESVRDEEETVREMGPEGVKF